MQTAQQHGRRTLLLIAAVFVVPILVAVYLYYSDGSLRPSVSTEHGELISPPRTLPNTRLVDGADTKQLYGIWNLVVLAGNQCDSICVETLEHIRQIRLSMGPKMLRVQTVYFPAAATAIPQDVAEFHPALVVVDPAVSKELVQIVGHFDNGQVFIVDPLGNVMMRYLPGTSMGDIREDLQRLLKFSGIG